jgi:hypothetical protein
MGAIDGLLTQEVAQRQRCPDGLLITSNSHAHAAHLPPTSRPPLIHLPIHLPSLPKLAAKACGSLRELSTSTDRLHRGGWLHGHDAR